MTTQFRLTIPMKIAIQSYIYVSWLTLGCMCMCKQWMFFFLYCSIFHSSGDDGRQRFRPRRIITNFHIRTSIIYYHFYRNRSLIDEMNSRRIESFRTIFHIFVFVFSNKIWERIYLQTKIPTPGFYLRERHTQIRITRSQIVNKKKHFFFELKYRCVVAATRLRYYKNWSCKL